MKIYGDVTSLVSFNAVKFVDGEPVLTPITPNVVEIEDESYTLVEVPQFTEEEAEDEAHMRIMNLGD